MITLFVGNLPNDTNEAATRELFSRYGTVQSVKVIPDAANRRFQGVGYVEMDDDEARAAIGGLDGRLFNGSILCVNEASQTKRAQQATTTNGDTLTRSAQDELVDNLIPAYRVASVEKAAGPEGAEGDEWCRYVLSHGRSRVTGLHPGTPNEVMEYAENCVETINLRMRKGKSTVASQFRKKK